MTSAVSLRTKASSAPAVRMWRTCALSAWTAAAVPSATFAVHEVPATAVTSRISASIRMRNCGPDGNPDALATSKVTGRVVELIVPTSFVRALLVNCSEAV